MSAPPSHVPLKSNEIVPYSFAVVYKEPVSSGFPAEFLKKVKDLCSSHPESDKGVPLPGVTTEFKELFQGFAGQFHPDVVKEMKNESVSHD